MLICARRNTEGGKALAYAPARGKLLISGLGIVPTPADAGFITIFCRLFEGYQAITLNQIETKSPFLRMSRR